MGFRLLLAIFFLFSLGCKSVQKIELSTEEINIPVDFNNYSFSKKADHPLRTIRISVHVFQDSLGRGNFTPYDSLGNQAIDWYWIHDLIKDASKKMAVLQPMNVPTTSQDITDSRIRYEVVGLYTWQDQSLFELNRISPTTGFKMLNYIRKQSEVTHQENSLHLFIAGGINKNGGRIASRGIASGAPSKDWTVLFNYYEQVKTKNNYWPASLISHEIGHNLGLRHTWNLNDGCNDTPLNSFHIDRNPSGFQCWNINSPEGERCDEIEEVSNNLMDYNAFQNALTECQMAKIHFNIENNIGGLKAIISTTKSSSKLTSVKIIGDDKFDAVGYYRIQGIPVGSIIKWYVSPREAVVNAVGSGTDVFLEKKSNFSGKALLTFEINNSEEISSFEKVFKIKSNKTP